MKAHVQLLRRAGVFLSGNVAAQAMSAVTGLLLARWLSVPDYAVYTVFITVMGAIAVVTKGGVHLGFTGILGRHWPNAHRAAQAVVAMTRVRRRISFWLLPPILLLSALLVYRAQPVWSLVLGVVGALLLFWLADMRSRIVDQVLFFAQQTGRVQWLDTGLAALRLLLIGGLFLLGGLNIHAALAVGALIALLRIRPILRWVQRIAPAGPATALDEDVREITSNARRQIPVELFYIMQGQAVLLTLALWGSAQETAGYGALTRIAQLLLPVQAFTYAFCVPYFAKAQDRIVKRFFQLVFMLSLPGITLATLVALFPQWVLMIIGPNYAGLEKELLWAALATGFTSIAGNAWSLVAHRGWVRWSWIQIPIGALWCLVAILNLPLGSIAGALIFQGGFAIGLVAATALELFSQTGATHERHNAQHTLG
ncbi:hypothetical protein [Hydrogenophaga sp. 5NK40-0174]|uniref:hypothetical protein n=1 Tax=Hydrogenophaga sp. 5NK40-0174 TaxID=3127649 RepID=UPI00310AF2A5